MPLLNYTTQVPAAKTVHEIMGNLVSHGASAILLNYDEQGQIESLSFNVRTPKGEVSIRLPIDPEAVLKVLSKGNVPRRYRTREQAVRIAWRIVKDWIEAQMAILETEMVKMEQIFLPYIITPSGHTLYEYIAERRFLLEEGAS